MAQCSNPALRRYLFSATLPPAVEDIARTVMHDPVRIVIGQRNTTAETISQRLMFVGNEQGKLLAIRQLIAEVRAQGLLERRDPLGDCLTAAVVAASVTHGDQGVKPPVLVFVQSIERAKELFHELVYDGINVEVIHSERTQAQRDNIVANFRMGRIWFLIATELLSRGMDFKGVNLVINYDFPQSTVSYIHRIGAPPRAWRLAWCLAHTFRRVFADAEPPPAAADRASPTGRAGRAGRPGEAVTLYTLDDAPYLRRCEAWPRHAEGATPPIAHGQVKRATHCSNAAALPT